jgi:sirohydrochlorin cobaltochelatase
VDKIKKRAVVLVGHGGLPKDISSQLVDKFMRIHKTRVKTGSEITKQEIELDQAIRRWQRTPESDPYKTGLEQLAAKLRLNLNNYHVVTAYNEFCYPTINDAIAGLAQENYSNIILVTTMITRGGSHSENEIPEEINELRIKYPDININYAWPFCMNSFAEFIGNHIKSYNT